MQHISRKLAMAVLATACTFGRTPTAPAQFGIVNGRLVQSGDAEAQEPRQLVDTNRSLSRQFERAKEALGTDKFREAVQFLQEGILDRSEDYFVDQDMKMSLKREALQLIANLPDEARRHYDLQYGRVAEQMLADAKETRDVAQLEEIARRFFHTAAGYEATYLLGTHYLDRSSPFAAALQFQQLRQMPEVARRWEPLLSLKTAVAWGRAGLRDKSTETLQQLKNATQDGHISHQGRKIPLFPDDGDPIAWLVSVLGEQQEFAGLSQEAWAMFRGDPTRNATAAPSTPVWDGAWSLPTITRTESRDAQRLEDVHGRLRELEEEHTTSSFLTLPAAHPLVVGDSVVFRTLSNLRAVDAQTGELLWETAIIDPSYEYLVEQSNDMPVQANQPSMQQLYLTQRAWRDMTAGTLSTDGTYVYALEDLGFVGPFGVNPNAPQHVLAPKDYNRLMAFELATGKIKWEVGGPRGDYALDQAGTYFLGPPLPLGKELYCLAEYSGEIRLLVLDAETGEQKWSQTLILPQASLPLFPIRRMAGLSPSYADGVMVCATAGGAVIAVDLTRRLVMWGHQYADNSGAGPYNLRALNGPALLRARLRNRLHIDSSDDEARWIDSVPTIAEGRVLLTSRDSDELICLRLIDGSVVWKRPRGQSLYVAGVHDGRVVLVGRTLVEAVRLDDGENAWNEPLPIPMPSGRGVREGSLYHLPLSTAEVATIDLDSGRLIARSQSRTGTVPGNLVAAGGVLVSQTIDSIEGYRSLSALEQEIADRLRANADDAGALALRGEMRLHQGAEREGLADLRKSLAVDAEQSRAKEVLVAALLEGLRFDFARYRTTTEEIETLADNPQQRSRFLRLYAAGLQQVGEHEAAFESFLKLARAETGAPQLERLSASLSVRSDRWVRPRILALFEAAKPPQQARMTEAIRRQLDAAVAADDPAALHQFLNCFAGLPMAADARRALVKHLEGEDRRLELEMNLRELHRTDDPALAAFATARLAKLYLDVKKGSAAAGMIEELATRWADETAQDDKTGGQLAEQWRAADDTAGLLAETERWPERHLEATRIGRRGSVERDHAIDFLGPRGPFVNWTLMIDNRRQHLIARDPFGVERWRLAIADLKDPHNPDDRTRNVPNIYGNNVRVHGHLMVVTLGSYFVVLDVLSDEKPRVLWLRDLFESAGNADIAVSTQFRAMPRGGARQKIIITDSMQRPMGTVGTITDEQITYQVGTTLYAADVLTGEVLWERRNISRGSEIFGDRDFIFVVPQNSTQAMIVRSGDGDYVATRDLPPPETQLLQTGRHLVTWTVLDDKATLALHDALTGQNAWTHTLPADALTAEVQGDEVAVLEPNGRFAVYSVDDGRLQLEAQLPATAGLEQIHVVRSRDRYVLLTNVPERQPNVRAVAVGQNMVAVNGMVYGFDRATRQKLWQTRVEQQTFDPNQPSELPALVFSVRRYRVFARGRVMNPNRYAVLILDARNGEEVYDEEGGQPLSPFLVRMHPEQKKIELDFYQSVIELTLGETALDEPRDTPAEAERPEGT